ncbi:hypothetical protein Q6288_28410, partial [Klebsiella quasipneumoniae]|uniref:hypothetical protein n=1 Tax=Klebsiella quasipneumoniae TaxID=1463165 RepID=UPI002730F8CE
GRLIIASPGSAGRAADRLVLGENILWMLVVFGFLYGIPYGVNATYMTESFEAKFRGSLLVEALPLGF